MAQNDSSNKEPQNNSRWWLAGGVALAAVALALLLELNYAAEHGRPLFFIGYLVVERIRFAAMALAPALGVAAAAAGIGVWFLPRRVMSMLWRTERVLLSAAAGCGVLSVCVLLLGLAGMLTKVPAIILILAGIGAGLPRARCLMPTGEAPAYDESGKVERSCDRWIARIVHVLIAFAAVLLVCGSLTPPLVYDVTEYHLGAFTDLVHGVSAGTLRPMPHNFYGRFPFPVESLYDLGLIVEWPRDFAAKALNGFFTAGCAVMALSMAGRLGARRPFPQLAALLVLAHPTMLEVGLDAYIDAPVAFLVGAAIYALLLIGGFAGGAAIPQLLPAAALILGTALVSKYTAAQLFLVPFALLLVWPTIGAVRGSEIISCGGSRGRIFGFAAILLLLVPLFWLGKNAVFYGNPLEPFFSWGATASARERFYIQAHRPQSLLSADYWRSLPVRAGAFGWLLIAPLAVMPLMRGRREVLVRLVLFVGISYASWNLIGQSEARFLLPSVLVLAVVSAVALSSIGWRFAAGSVAVIFCGAAALNLLFQSTKFANGDVFGYVLNAPISASAVAESSGPSTEREKYYETNLGMLGRLMTDAHRKLPSNAKVLLVYEARPYLLREYPTVYNTVWDDSVLLPGAKEPAARSAADVSRRLRERFGVTHVLVNEEELRRLIEQYAPARQLESAGVSPKMDRSLAYFATATPADLYPPFFRSGSWLGNRMAVLDFLKECRARAVAVESYKRVSDGPAVEMFISPLP